MKILIIHNPYLEKGGEDEVVNAEIRLLKGYGHEVIFYEKSNAFIERLPFFKKLFFVLFELRFSKVIYKEIKAIVAREKPDIAHIHNIFFCITPSVYLALKEENVPIVQTLHNYRFICGRGTFFKNGAICEKCRDKRFFNSVIGRCWRNSFVLSFLLARIFYEEKNFLKYIDSFIVLSNFSKLKFIEFGLEERKLHLKGNFLEIENKENRLDQDYALFIGRIVDYKGIETLIKAFKLNPLLKLKIIGDGPLKKDMRGFTVSLDNIQWLGKLEKDDVFEAIKGSSFLIFPSECYENMPLAIMESFAFSKPVIASNLGAIKELVIDGVNGMLFQGGDASDLSAKASYLLSHNKERIEMGKNANKIYQERFNKEKNYQDLMGIYMKTKDLKKDGRL